MVLGVSDSDLFTIFQGAMLRNSLEGCPHFLYTNVVLGVNLFTIFQGAMLRNSLHIQYLHCRSLIPRPHPPYFQAPPTSLPGPSHKVWEGPGNEAIVMYMHMYWVTAVAERSMAGNSTKVIAVQYVQCIIHEQSST